MSEEKTTDLMKVQEAVGLASLIDRCHKISLSKGWWETDSKDFALRRADLQAVSSRLCLVHSEVSEALEALREGKIETEFKDGKPEGMEVELADVIIRIFDMAGGLDLDLVAAIRTKMEYNRGRSHRHGKRF